MKFHIDHTPAPARVKLTHDSRVMLTGSCFSDNIGELLLKHRFNAQVNPGGIFFNPSSIAGFLSRVIKEQDAPESSFLTRGEKVFSYNHHSTVHAENNVLLNQQLTSLYKTTRQQIEKADFLFITFGTAFVYTNKATNDVVANCHKQPQQLFDKRLLSVEEIVTGFNSILNDLHKINPRLTVVFTVSPVKHLRDGIEQNSLSKATLLLSCHHLVKNAGNCLYFPAFELVNDDLRDYRFYAPDMAHPNEEAIDYIWEKFTHTFFSKETAELVREIGHLNKAEAHRALHANAAEEKALQEYLESQKKRILTINPRLDL